jgi:hypothetical protein
MQWVRLRVAGFERAERSEHEERRFCTMIESATPQSRAQTRIVERVPPEEPIAANKTENRDAELAALTNDELDLLTALLPRYVNSDFF